MAPTTQSKAYHAQEAARRSGLLRGTAIAFGLLQPGHPGETGGRSTVVDGMKVQFVPVGRTRREWMWKARDESSNTITISGRFDSLSDAMRDAREQFEDGLPGPDLGDDDGPFAA